MREAVMQEVSRGVAAGPFGKKFFPVSPVREQVR
jgi:hypothetical protein